MRTLIIISLIALSLSGNAATIKSYLLNNKFTRAGAAGVMGNLYAESGLNPRVYERSKHKRIGLSDEDYIRKTNDGSYKNFINDKAGFGIALWVHYSKKRELLNMCRGKISDLYCQLNFFIKDLKEYPGVYKILKNTHDLNTACDKIFIDFGGYEFTFKENRNYCKKFI